MDLILMAIDSVDKRRSMMGLDFEWAWYPPQADGVYSAADLRQWNLIYREPLCFGLFDHAIPKSSCDLLTAGEEPVLLLNPEGIATTMFVMDHYMFLDGSA